MARWDSNAVGRLIEAAMALYRDPGYDKVTVAEIAGRAGLTRRTFFRYFADKREVLFFGTQRLEALVTEGIRTAPAGTPALDAVGAALAPVARLSDEDPAHAEYARQRHAVIQNHAELRERELGKHAALATAIVEALRLRGVAAPAARLAAEAGLAAFSVGFEQWVEDRARRKMATHVEGAMRVLESVAGGAIVLASADAAPRRKKRRR